MSVERLRFATELEARPPAGVLTVETTLEHFSIVTYGIDPLALQRQFHPRFVPDLVADSEGTPRALISAVTFLDRDFRSVLAPWWKQRFGQTNYRSYVTDTATGEHVAWFFGTCLDSALVVVPRHLWQLPWHRARFEFDCVRAAGGDRYATYRVATRSAWAPAELDLEDAGAPPTTLDGFPDLETGLVLLTQPTRGFYFRRDGALGSYSIWHDRMQPTIGAVKHARFPLFERLGLLAPSGAASPHSVLLAPTIDFTIYLPPRRVDVPPVRNRGA